MERKKVRISTDDEPSPKVMKELVAALDMLKDKIIASIEYMNDFDTLTKDEQVLKLIYADLHNKQTINYMKYMTEALGTYQTTLEEKIEKLDIKYENNEEAKA